MWDVLGQVTPGEELSGQGAWTVAEPSAGNRKREAGKTMCVRHDGLALKRGLGDRALLTIILIRPLSIIVITLTGDEVTAVTAVLLNRAQFSDAATACG